MAQGHEDSVFAGTKCVDPDSRPSPDPLSIQRVDEHDVDLAPFEGEQGLLVVEAPQDEPIYLRGAAPVRRVGDELGVAFWHMGHQPEWARADGGGEGELGGVHLVVLDDNRRRTCEDNRESQPVAEPEGQLGLRLFGSIASTATDAALLVTLRISQATVRKANDCSGSSCPLDRDELVYVKATSAAIERPTPSCQGYAIPEVKHVTGPYCSDVPASASCRRYWASASR